METETIQVSLETEYDTLRAELLEAHQPRNAHERVLVEEFVDAVWDLKAARRVDREFWFYAGSHYASGPAGIAQAQFEENESRFRTHLRHLAMAQRSYYRALDALKALRRDLPRAVPATDPAPQVEPKKQDLPQSPALVLDNNGLRSDNGSRLNRQSRDRKGAVFANLADTFGFVSQNGGFKSS